MQIPRSWMHLLFCLAWVVFSLTVVSRPAQAAVDPYVLHYLRVTDAIELPFDRSGAVRSFSASQLSEGKQFFERNCANCHVGGSTLPNPSVPLSLAALKGAEPPRETVVDLVRYFRHPTTYDGTEDMLWCREVPDTWLAETAAENLAAFILRAAQIAPGWGVETFQGS